MTNAAGISEIAKTIRCLMERDGVNVHQLSMRTGIPASTLYAMQKKSTNEADIRNLKKIADAFGERLDIFCGREAYVRPVELSAEEHRLLDAFRAVNPAGKGRLLAYAAELAEHPRYYRG